MIWEGLSPPYRTIVADPPWHYDGFAGGVGRGGYFAGSAEQVQVKVKPLPYSSLSVEAIAALPVGELADRDSWLALWTTNRYLGAAFNVLAAWGFAYRQTLVWRKTGNPIPFGGTIAPNHCEFLLLAAKGSPGVVARQSSNVIEAQKPNVHSLKPSAALDLIEWSCPGPYVELFARAPRLGWDSWGYGYESAPQRTTR